MKKDIDEKMSDLVMFRGTKKEIYTKINCIYSKKDASVSLLKRDLLKDNDFFFEVCLGMDKGVYFDYEVFVLPTNKEDCFIITEVTTL